MFELIADLECDGFGYYLAGLIDGEGSFIIARKERGYHAVMRMKLRDDDAAILYECQRRTGLGRVFPEKVYAATGRDVRNVHPQMVWAVHSKADVAKLVLILQCFPLRAKKRTDFEIWCLAVREWITKRRYGGWETLEALRLQLIARRGYEASEDDPDSKPAPVLHLQPSLEGMSDAGTGTRTEGLGPAP